MPGTRAVILSAATIVAALGLAGCSQTPPRAPAPSYQASRTTTVPVPPTADPLPPPDALTGVLYHLADTSIPVEQKVGLVQYATIDDQSVLANFGEALKANGFDPSTSRRPICGPPAGQRAGERHDQRSRSAEAVRVPHGVQPDAQRMADAAHDRSSRRWWVRLNPDPDAAGPATVWIGWLSSTLLGDVHSLKQGGRSSDP